MSTDVAVLPDNLLDVRTGELLPATPENAADLMVAARDLRTRLNALIKDCTDVLVEESRRQGTKTLKLEGATATVAGGSETAWDLEVLAQLLAVGLPDERYEELIKTTVTYTVDARVAKQLAAANPNYKRIIDAAKTTIEKPWRVSVK